MSNILEYLINNIPKSYESTYLLKELKEGVRGVVCVQITASRFYKNMLFIESTSESFKQNISIVIFNAKAFHTQIFARGKTLNVLGTLSFRADNYTHTLKPTMVNPKVVSQTDTITASFKKRGITLENMQKKITLQALLDSNIPKHYANAILKIYNPTYEFFQDYIQTKNLPNDCIDAIKFCEIFLYLQRLSHKKREFDAKFQCKGEVSSFISSLPFSLTNAQLDAISTIKKDLESSKAARRIIMGDVGCGKTMVILASVLLAYPQKSALMAPTSILARQLYTEALKFLPSHIKCACILSANTKKEREAQAAAMSEAHFLIGTQALLYKDSDFSEYALVMTDEQHRFGTNTRLYLEKMLESSENKKIKKPHNLQFSATPIPRTMAMMQSRYIDFTFIKDLPFKKDIETRIIEKSDFKALLAHIKEEIAKGNQVAIIYPKIESKAQEEELEQEIKKDSLNIDNYQNLMESNFYAQFENEMNVENELKEKEKKSRQIPYMSLNDAINFWEKNFSKVFVTHGKDKEKESILESFASSKGAILLATTMVEVGISLPNLTIIVIVGAERLGLASLHQLRGRVSRNGLKGYCYLYTHNTQNERLSEFSKTISGFDIAELDLKYRSSGDLLSGKEQSGGEFLYFNMALDSNILQEAKKVLDTALIKES